MRRLLGFAILLGGCASAPRTSTTTITRAEVTDLDRASTEIRRGDFDHALADADAAVRRAPGQPWARYDQGVALHHLGRTDAAVIAFREAEARFGSDARGRGLAIYGRARALADAGRCAEARAAYQDFARSAPGAAREVMAYADDCRERATPTSPTVSAMSRAVLAGDPRRVLELADKAPPEATADPWFHHDLAVALAAMGRTDDAVREYQDAARRFPEDSPGRRDAAFGIARAYDEAGRCADASRAYADFAGTVREASPHDADAAMEMARACKWK